MYARKVKKPWQYIWEGASKLNQQSTGIASAEASPDDSLDVLDVTVERKKIPIGFKVPLPGTGPAFTALSYTWGPPKPTFDVWVAGTEVDQSGWCPFAETCKITC